MNNEKILDISWATILKIIVAAIGIYFLYLISDFLVWLAFAFVIAILFEPAIEWLGRRRIPRLLSVIFIYVLIFSAFSTALYFSLPYLISEIQYFSEIFPQQFPEFFGKISPFFEKLGFETFSSLDVLLGKFQIDLEKMTGNIFSAFFAIFGGIFSTLFTVTISIFLSIERKSVEKGLTLLFPKKYEDYLLAAWIKSQKKVIGWFLLRIIGMVFVGISSYIALLFLDVEYPISLGVIAGVFDFLPIIGPFFAAIIAFIVVAMDDMLKAVFLVVAFGLIQAIENGILLPVLSKKMIQVSPIVVLLALFIGGKFWGVLGAIMAVPLAAILLDFLKDFLEKRKEEGTEKAELENP